MILEDGVVGLCVNGKKCYKTKVDAEFALYKCQSSKRDNTHKEKRVYFCPTCKYFHLTSQEKKKTITWKSLNNVRK
jgi:hypothetical protein